MSDSYKFSTNNYIQNGIAFSLLYLHPPYTSIYHSYSSTQYDNLTEYTTKTAICWIAYQNLDIIELIVNTFFSEPVEYHIVDVCVMVWHLLLSQYTFHVCRDLLFFSVIASGSNKIGKSKRKRQLVCFWF